MSLRATRRELVVTTLTAVGAATGLAALAGPADAAPAETEADVLSKALVTERLMVVAYRRVLGSGRLAQGVARTVSGMLTHELEHVSAVASRLAEMGAPAPTGPIELASADALLAKHHVTGSLTQLPTTQGACLVLLVDLESVAEGAYFDGLRYLTNPSLIRLSAQIMSCQAQHWTVLMQLLNPGKVVKAVPWPFVLGTS